ncbi:MAG: kinesin motor protein cin8 [Sclerophora amabilis]|nr:MAG: kinesin motor protein cin8 [Sclerophora amabilis]
MAALSRPTSGLTTKKNSNLMRPPNTRPPSVRGHSAMSQTGLNARAGTVSPANSVASLATSSRARSPATQRAGAKRKERDFEHDPMEETNVHVAVRCRGRNDREVRENSGVVLSTNGVRGKSIELSMGPNALSNKTYHFDKVFSPAADQSMIYDEVVTPILDEMLSGYNCTIFAYGQTGTGKTYTMSGDMSDQLGLLSDAAGIIPRALHSLFAKLEAGEAESSVKCSFIELYNEELRDLLSVDDSAKLKLFEDASKKGHGATLVQGMEESHIKNAGEGVNLLRNGSHKRQVAATKCNDLSSRSHTIFTVTAYVKRTAENGEDYLSAGKLNLVDLAGSENIQRSGAEHKRATEAGLINKSLLTLGRVINALVDKSSHIPYRESKLTRLLQDSLGGRTKTCIIATVSPAKSNLEETISTLDYAFRAKNIRNKPQVNQTISKKTLLREFTGEIEKLKSELIATRQRNGVYLTNDSYEEMTNESESRRILSEEQRAKIETMETNLRNKVQELFTLTTGFNALRKDSESTKATLDGMTGVLEKTEFVLENTRQLLAEETILRKAHQTTEEELSVIGSQLLATVDQTVTDVGGLHSKLRRKSDLETANRSSWKSSQAQVSDVTRLVEMRLNEFQSQQDALAQALSAKMEGFVRQELQSLGESRSFLQDQATAFDKSESEISEQTSKSRDDMNEVLEEIKTLREDVKQRVGEGLSGLSAAAARISADVIGELGGFHEQLHTSYSSLGRDFKGIFEDLLKHLNMQRAEADELRRDLSAATALAMQANDAASSNLETLLAEERKQASDDRKNLLEQIGGLVNASGQAQDERFASKIGQIRSEMDHSRTKFEVSQTNYNNSMDAWSQKEQQLVDEVLQSRETLKGKLKKDWLEANDHHSSIQTSTKSIHEETVRIVDAQIGEISKQMQALDDFVSRARSENGRTHEAHAESFRGLASTVRRSYTSIQGGINSAYNRVEDLGQDVSRKAHGWKSSLPPIESDMRQPLTELRSNIMSTALKEYVSTGETPQKQQYQYPSTLPRTDAHEFILSGTARRGDGGSTPAHPDTLDMKTSPSKGASTAGMVFTDSPDVEVAPTQPAVDEGDSIARPATTGGLREVNVNVAAGAAAAAAMNSEPPMTVTLETDNDGSTLPPPLKKHHTFDSRLPPKNFASGAGKTASSIVKLEGRENNVIPLGFSASVGGGPAAGTRRKTRQSPN